jgi:hypothetical protein
VFIMLTDAQYFVMTYAIITGAHFFPYAWYYKSMAFAVMAGVISVGSFALGVTLSPDQMYLLPFAMAGALAVLAGLLMVSWRTNVRAFAQG